MLCTLMTLGACSSEQVDITHSTSTNCLFAERLHFPLSAIKHSEKLEGLDLSKYLIKNMDDPDQIEIVDEIIRQQRYLDRVIPLHQRQIASSNYIYQNRCLE